MKNKKAIVFLGSLFILMVSSFTYSQRMELTPLQLDENMVTRKIAWINNEKSCVIVDKSFSAKRFLHLVFLFDKEGNLLGEPTKIKTINSCQHSYCFTLGTTVYFLEDSHDYGVHRFHLRASVTQQGGLNDSAVRIFQINETEENSKLNNPHYNFNVYTGTGGSRALLAYNNDYKENFKEGFRYRILEENGNLSDEKTFYLPYNDFESNIDDIIYDDEKNIIYALCDLFEIKGKKDRVYKNSFVISHEILSGVTLEKPAGTASFYKNKVQHLFTKDQVAFAGLSMDAKESSKWALSFLAVSADMQHVIFSDRQNLKVETVNGFKRKSNHFEFIFPVALMKTNDTMYSISWCNMLNVDQYAFFSTSNSGIGGVAGGIGGGILGAAAGAGLYAAIGIPIATSSLWINYFPGDKKMQEAFVETKSRNDNYFLFPYSAITSEKSSLLVMNKPGEKKRSETSVCFINMDNDSLSDEDDIQLKLKANSINFIQPASLYQDPETNYFLASKTDRNSLKYFLLEIKK